MPEEGWVDEFESEGVLAGKFESFAAVGVSEVPVGLEESAGRATGAKVGEGRASVGSAAAQLVLVLAAALGLALFA